MVEFVRYTKYMFTHRHLYRYMEVNSKDVHLVHIVGTRDTFNSYMFRNVRVPQLWCNWLLWWTSN